MKILVTGPSGMIGFPAVIQFAQQSEHEVTLFDLKTKESVKKLTPYRHGFEIVYGDITRVEEVEAVCQGKDVVIHLAALIPPLADEQPELAYQVNVKGTQNIVSGLEKHSPDAFLLYASSIANYGDRLENPYIQVGDPLIPSVGDEYAKTKIEAEQIIQSSQLDWSIFRLSAICGIGTKGHSPSGLMFHMPLNTPIEFTTPDDTARAFIIGAKFREELKHRIFNLGGGEQCRTTYKELLQTTFAAVGLGELDFPSKAFAEKNFHCALYADSDELEEILHFRRWTTESYFDAVKKDPPFFQKLLASIFRKKVKRDMLKLSEPYHAYLTKDEKMMNRFFYRNSLVQ